MKKCSRCKQEKPETEFSFKNKTKGTKRSDCKECFAKLVAVHYQNNKEKYKEAFKKTRKRSQQFIYDLKEKIPCTDCGNYYPHYIMDYDHIDASTKKEKVSTLARCSKKTALEEIAKCELVCANCHRERTHQRAAEASLQSLCQKVYL